MRKLMIILVPLLALAPAAASAQTYPTRSIEMIVPFPAGANSDLAARPLADALSKALDDEGVRKRLLDLGSDIPGPDRRGQAALNKLVDSEINRWTPVIKASGITQ